jgi:hypothetical protein
VRHLYSGRPFPIPCPRLSSPLFPLFLFSHHPMPQRLSLPTFCRYPVRGDRIANCLSGDACRGGSEGLDRLESSIVFTAPAAAAAALSVLVINFISCLMWQPIRCTHPNCSCDCFAPGRGSKRTCSTCQHGWISHGTFARSLLFARFQTTATTTAAAAATDCVPGTPLLCNSSSECQ